ncbi:SKI family transcriptional corepressor 2-like [Diprion similis]|uniref:SKI family transcriptional corepressor 2-like n=1 Tax=Diprion similis TaxID=362088 RepID=UPI001EF8809F|nr:SKI family transcriptional corepressor 2-like [Diprion similis]
MYAAAGGASIASRRKQKRLLLHKRGGSGGGVVGGAGRGAVSSAVTSGEHHHQAQGQGRGFPGGNIHHLNHYNHHNHHNQSNQQQARTKSAPFPSSRQSRISRPPNLHPPLPSSAQHQCQPNNQHHHHHHHHHQHQQQQLIPVSPITFPISPPPLSVSLESSKSLTYSVSKSNHFPFPPPPDLRVSSSTELQCSGQSQAQGKAAWQGCSRPSPLPLTPVSPIGSRAGDGLNYKTKQCEAHRRWMKRNRIRDASYCYGSSGEEEEDGQEWSGGRRRGEVSAAVNTVLYAGLGTTALGLVISFVGTGEKGFQSSELRLVGPSLLCAGLLCCLLRVLLCLCLCHCGKCQWGSSSSAAMKSDKLEKASAKEQNNVQPAPSLLTASLLPPLRSVAATVSPPPPAVKGRELLLSAAQLSE